MYILTLKCRTFQVQEYCKYVHLSIGWSTASIATYMYREYRFPASGIHATSARVHPPYNTGCIGIETPGFINKMGKENRDLFI
jgi:hypothetical protein